jgi:two-component system, NarL family, response regulator DevR
MLVAEAENCMGGRRSPAESVSCVLDGATAPFVSPNVASSEQMLRDRESMKVFLVDDHEVVRSGMRRLLETDDALEVIGEAGTVEEALRLATALAPDVAVLDLQLPDGDGIELCRELRSRMPALHCLMLTGFADDEALFAAIMAGASGYVLKQISAPDLVSAVRRAAAGESLLDLSLTAEVRQRIREGPKRDERLGSLSNQERRVLDLVAEGLTNRQIGETLFLAEKTVKNYVSKMLAKLGMAHRSEAAAFAARVSEREAASDRRSGR